MSNAADTRRRNSSIFTAVDLQTVQDSGELLRYLFRREVRMPRSYTGTRQLSCDVRQLGGDVESADGSDPPIGLLLESRRFGGRVSGTHQMMISPLTDSLP